MFGFYFSPLNIIQNEQYSDNLRNLKLQQIETMRQVKLEESYIITGKSLIAMDVSYFDGQIKLSLNLCRDNIYFS